jgi:hypothetical protein
MAKGVQIRSRQGPDKRLSLGGMLFAEIHCMEILYPLLLFDGGTF